jgi:hypothetical protein
VQTGFEDLDRRHAPAVRAPAIAGAAKVHQGPAGPAAVQPNGRTPLSSRVVYYETAVAVAIHDGLALARKCLDACYAHARLVVRVRVVLVIVHAGRHRRRPSRGI